MNGFIDGNPAVGGDVSVAARPKQATLCRRTSLFFTVGQPNQGGAVAAAGETGGPPLNIDGSLPAPIPTA